MTKLENCFWCDQDAKNGGKVWHPREKEWKQCCVSCAWNLYDEVDGNIEVVDT